MASLPLNPALVQAAIFDMDGLLIDSEPIWQDSEILVFEKYGLSLSREDCMQTMGLRIDEVVGYWKERQRDTLTGIDNAHLVKEILQEVKTGILNHGQPMEGAKETVNFLYEIMPLALASSSYPEIIEATMQRLEWKHRFQFLHSAIHEKKGKPAPDVYLSACRILGISPAHCMALEDSPGGVRSALDAGMQVIAVPHPDHRDHPDIARAHLILPSLKDFRWPPA